jgi:hypothetical protein
LVSFHLGHDKSEITIENGAKTNPDEVKSYLDARYVSASESSWRIFGFSLNEQYPNTVRLAVHLENEQNILFELKDKISNIVDDKKNTQMSQYFQLCADNDDLKDMIHIDLPKHYRWHGGKWIKRKSYCFKLTHFFFLI